MPDPGRRRRGWPAPWQDLLATVRNDTSHNCRSAGRLAQRGRLPGWLGRAGRVDPTLHRGCAMKPHVERRPACRPSERGSHLPLAPVTKSGGIKIVDELILDSVARSDLKFVRLCFGVTKPAAQCIQNPMSNVCVLMCVHTVYPSPSRVLSCLSHVACVVGASQAHDICM